MFQVSRPRALRAVAESVGDAADGSGGIDMFFFASGGGCRLASAAFSPAIQRREDSEVQSRRERGNAENAKEQRIRARQEDLLQAEGQSSESNFR